MPKSLLVIDDNLAITAALEARLGAHGYDVRVADRGHSGLRAAREYAPALIILDVRLPDIDGIEVCRMLKLDPDLSSIPVIFLSANAAPTVHEQALDAGGAAFVRKPYDAQNLLDLIRRVLETTDLPVPSQES